MRLLLDDEPAVRRRAVACLGATALRNHRTSLLDVCAMLDAPRDRERQAALAALRVLVAPEGCKLVAVEVPARPAASASRAGGAASPGPARSWFGAASSPAAVRV